MSIYLEAKIAGLNKLHIIVNMLCPKRTELVHGNIKPRFHISIEVDHCSIVNLIHAYAWIVAKTQNMPGLVQRLCC